MASSALKKKKKNNLKNGVDLSTMSVSDFMKSSFDSEGSDDQSSILEDSSLEEEETAEQSEGSSAEGEDMTDDEDGGDDDDDDGEDDNVNIIVRKGDDDSGEESDGSNLFDGQSHKKSLQKLRQTDPDFYKFLEENDKKLLDFNVSDSEDDNEEEDKVHKPAEELEVASDESDFEVEGKEADERVVTLKMVKSVQEQLHNTKCVAALRQAVQMFHSALQRVAAPKEEDEEPAQYVVDGSSVFNAVVQMCVLDLQPAIKRCLGLPTTGKIRTSLNKCKKWSKVKILLRLYLNDLLKIITSVSSPQILTVLLKHLHQLMVFIPYFPKLKRPLLKRLVRLWSSGEETVRVVAFLCILKMTTNEQQVLLEQALKMMYLSYVRNCKFVSPSTLPSIQFMRRSLAEMFALDEAASYQHVFLYVRQLAIHLRNAITLHNKESIQAVYNWQFVQSLHLWTEVLGATAHRPYLQPLLYPLVQVIIGTIKLIPTSQYYPLRFHCVHMLIQLSKQTATFIPVLPFILEVLTAFNFNKAHKKVSMKPLDLTCILRLSKSQLQENGFKDAIIEKIYTQLLEYLASEAHTISFPDMVIPAVIQLKKFVKECKSPNYSRMMKQVQEKIEENCRAIEAERRKVSFALTDRKAIDAWETNMKLKGTPLVSYYESWNKMNIQKMAKRITDNDKLGEYNLPTLKKHVKKELDADKSDGPVDLFPSSDESDSEVASALSGPPSKRKRGARGRRGKGRVEEEPLIGLESLPKGEDDIVQDLNLSDFD